MSEQGKNIIYDHFASVIEPRAYKEFDVLRNRLFQYGMILTVGVYINNKSNFMLLMDD